MLYTCVRVDIPCCYIHNMLFFYITTGRPFLAYKRCTAYIIKTTQTLITCRYISFFFLKEERIQKFTYEDFIMFSSIKNQLGHIIIPEIFYVTTMHLLQGTFPRRKFVTPFVSQTLHYTFIKSKPTLKDFQLCTYDTWVKDLPNMISTCTHLNSSYSVVRILFINAFYSLMGFAFVSLLYIVNFFRYNRKGAAAALVYIFGDVVVSSSFL